MQQINITIVDDHTLFREGLKLLLQNFSFVGSITEAENGIQFLKQLESHCPDVVLMDIDMPGIDGVETTAKALNHSPQLKIIALSMFGEEEYYYQMIGAGARGFLLKNSEVGIVREAIQTVAEGSSYFSEELLYNIVKNIKKSNNSQAPQHILSEREQEILMLICKGLSNAEIAENLSISKRTVDKHRENILSKTESKNTASLVMFAIKNKLVDI